MVGWHHRLNGHGFGWSQGVGDKQGGLACCDSWGHKESDTTERLNRTLELKKDKEIFYNKLYQSLTLSHTHTHIYNTLSHNFTKYFHGVRKSTDKGDSPGRRI